MNDEDLDLEFNRGAVRPVQCLQEGWQLIKDEYWFFLGVAVLGTLIGSMAAIILAGPMMCGVDICLLRRMDRQRTGFNNLFDGFNFFLPSFLASLFPTLTGMILVGLVYVAFCGAMFGVIAAMAPQGGGPPDNPGLFVGSLLGIQALLFLAILVVSVLAHLPFVFIYPLIVDHKASALTAVRLSVRAVLANLGGVLGLTLLQALLVFAGLLACYVGAIFVLPVTMAANVVAYRHIFPAPPAPREVVLVDEPDSAEASTGIQAEAPRDRSPETGITPE